MRKARGKYHVNTYEFDTLTEMANDGTIERYFMAKVYTAVWKVPHRIVMVANDGQNFLPLDPEPSKALRLHSPDGFNWGYGGSGPNQLALAILLDFTGDAKIAEQFYRKFVWAHVATWSDTWKITGQEIHDWLVEERLK